MATGTGNRAARVGVAVLAVGIASALAMSASPPPDRVASVIETLLGWAVEGRSIPSDPPKETPALPHRDCGGRLDPEHLPGTVYVTWQLSGEGQHAACNWKYDVASRRATPLTQEEAAAVTARITANELGPQERAFFHSVPQRDGRLTVTVGYCWGSAIATLAFPGGGPVVTGELAIHGY